jgi:hypothetical protein
MPGAACQCAQAVAQHRLREIANNSAQGMQLKALQNMAQNGARSLQFKALAPNRTGLPDNLKTGIEALSGMSMDHVRVHHNSAQPAKLNAHAYAQGSEIHVAPGQERHLPHEAWHVVQQAQGRVKPTMQMKAGVAVNDDAGLEAEADLMGARALRHAAVQPPQPSVPADAVAGLPTLQLALVAQPGGFSTDTRNPGAQRFTSLGGNAWRDQHGYRYHYTANQEFLITHDRHGAYPAQRYWDIEHEVELRRHTMAAPNHAPLHIYTTGASMANWLDRRMYTPGHLYRPVPTSRVSWIDANGRYVDNMDRVLAPNGQGVDKAYAVAKEGRDHVVPFKQLGGGYNSGLPGLYGGNIDPGETAAVAIGREMGEESGNAVALNAIGGQLSQSQFAAGPDRNRYTISSASVVTGPATAPPQEMAGQFRFTSSAFVGHTATLATTKARLLALFQQHAAATPGLAAYAAHAAGLTAAQLNDWTTSHGMGALAGAITQDVASYNQGANLARAAQPLPPAAGLDEQAGHQFYLQGAADARLGLGVQNAHEPAYGTGHADYLQGLADAQLGHNANAHAGYVEAQTDYTAGWQAARDHIAVPPNRPACTIAAQQYNQGLADAGGNIPAANAHVAYMAGYQN